MKFNLVSLNGGSKNNAIPREAEAIIAVNPNDENTAIEVINNKPVWVKEKCTLCLGCIHRCPKFSIDYKEKTKAHGQYLNPNTKI